MTTGSREPVWKGPYEDGITQSLAAKWMNCPHRFWLYAICGAVENPRFNLPIVYGDAFHNALEAYALGKLAPHKAGQRIKDTFHKQAPIFPSENFEITRWSRICYDQFIAYCKVWESEDKGYYSFMEEQPFNEPYTLPSGRTVRLRGKWDGGVASKSKEKESHYLFEHKIKGDIDSKNLPRTLAQNFQVMYYLPPLYTKLHREGQPMPCGVLYNVIKRPLSGGRHSIMQKKGRKTKDKESGRLVVKGAETQEMFLQRLAALYPANPNDFFYRWKVAISPNEITRFQIETLNPLLEQMCDWWDSIQGNPYHPWTTTKNGKEVSNSLHYRRPFGVYDKMAKGLVGDYQGYLTTGDKSNLKGIKTVFPELEE